MTLIDHSISEDQVADLMHIETEAHIKRLRIAFGRSRKQVMEHLVCFAENDEEAPVFPQRQASRASAKPAARSRRPKHE